MNFQTTQRPYPRHVALALKKQRLQMRSADLRRTFGQQMLGIRPITRGIDSGLSGVAWLRGHPQWLAAASVALFVVRPKRVFKLGMRLWSVTRLFGRLRPYFA